ncbi:GNAT family N-acetyltransferase [Streptomyces sp. NPDC091290]|uniref:GNAT family N-acetyltransferase n=1 Tax=Streptomyces sp. NPDC091290 TaxID=3365990 RepID=UPI0037F61C61
MGRRRLPAGLRCPCGRRPDARGDDRPALRGGGPHPRAGQRRLRPLPGLGRGLATRAVRLVCGYAAAAGARAAVIQVEPGNAASVAVARRAGFAPGGQRFADDGTLFDRYVRELG